jgi:hypothetical protein
MEICPKTIIFTGAGASKPLGYPTTTEFFPDQFSANNNHIEVLNATKNLLNADLVDIEDALSILEQADNFLNTRAGALVSKRLGNSWDVKIRDFTRYCRERCFELYGRMPTIDQVDELYSPLLTTVKWNTEDVSLFTTNYDPVTDFLLEIASEDMIEAYDGFGGYVGRWLPHKHESSGKAAMFRIYRLHGSMSWVDRDGRIINTRDYKLRSGGHADHLIIYPGYKGDPNTPETHEVYRYPCKQLNEQLNTATTLIVIGFSFRDAYLNNVFAKAMKNNDQLSMLIVNPEYPPGLDNSIDHLKKSHKNRVIHIAGKFGDIKVDDKIRDAFNNLSDYEMLTAINMGRKP